MKSLGRLLAIALLGSIAVWPQSGESGDSKKLTRDEAKKLKNPVPYTKKSITQGRNTFVSRCSTCHGNDGKAELDVVADATNLTAPKTFKSGSSDGEIFRSIRDGGVSPGGREGRASEREPRLCRREQDAERRQRDGQPTAPVHARGDAVPRGRHLCRDRAGRGLLVSHDARRPRGCDTYVPGGTVERGIRCRTHVRMRSRTHVRVKPSRPCRTDVCPERTIVVPSAP